MGFLDQWILIFSPLMILIGIIGLFGSPFFDYTGEDFGMGKTIVVSIILLVVGVGIIFEAINRCKCDSVYEE